MKKAYNQTWVENIENQRIAKEWHAQKLLTDEQLENTIKEFPVGFHKANIFVKAGLFLFTCIAISSSMGFLSLFLLEFLSNSPKGFAITSLIYAVGLFFFLELFIKNNNFYRSGTDNALLYAMLGSLFSFFLGITDFDFPTWVYCLIGLAILLPALLRYADPFVAIIVFFTWIGFWFTLVTQFPIGKIIIPFVVMILSAVCYVFIKFWRNNDSYYADSKNSIELLALATFYLGGNYLVVREGNALLNELATSIQISFAPLFYFFTVTIPVLYIISGLKKHDRKLLFVGILAFAFSILTYRQYFSVLPLEWAMTIGGIVLILLSVAAIKALKVPKLGLTYAANQSDKFQNLEAFIVNQAIQQPSPTPSDKQFGGGDFGGGGSGSGY